MSEPRFELGISDPIANHITTRPRGIYRILGKNFAILLISNMIYLYGLIQPIRGRNRVKSQLWKYQLCYESDSQAQLCQFKLCKYVSVMCSPSSWYFRENEGAISGTKAKDCVLWKKLKMFWWIFSFPILWICM